MCMCAREREGNGEAEENYLYHQGLNISMQYMYVCMWNTEYTQWICATSVSQAHTLHTDIQRMES